MSLRWLTPGLAVVVVSMFNCDNQGRGVGPDVIDRLCELNREAVLALHSEEGMAAENGKYSYTYCDYWVDNDGDGVPESPQVQGSCKALQPSDMGTIIAECKRNGVRIANRCWQEMEAMYACMTTQLEQAPSRLDFYSRNFNCWTDTNGNGSYNGAVYWTWPDDGSRPGAEVNHKETCPPACLYEGTCGSCGYSDVLDTTDTPIPKDCYLMKELPMKSDETVTNNNVTAELKDYLDPTTNKSVKVSMVCEDEYLALNRCAKESEGFLLNLTSGSGAAGVAGAGTQ